MNVNWPKNAKNASQKVKVVKELSFVNTKTKKNT